jgi:hypothetical protein
MTIITPTVAVLVAVAVIAVCCLAFPRVRRTIVALWDSLESAELVVFVLLAVVGALVGVVRWTLVRSLGDLLFGSS